LLKPQSEIGSQIVVQGRMVGTALAREYQGWKPRLMEAVLDSFGRLSAEADLILIEGAGSASEINLRPGDIANMGFARATGTPVVLVGDIDRGGVIASLVGTKAVLDPADAAMIQGFVVNRFRGDPALFADGMRAVAERTGWRSLGLVPHFCDASRLPAEDALGLGGEDGGVSRSRATKKIVVPVTPRIANFDDLDPLRQEPEVEVVWIERGRPLPGDATSSFCPARRPRSTISRSSASRVGTSTSGRMCGAAGACLGCAAATRCSGEGSRTRSGSRARRARSRGSGSLRSRPR
jgi:adenosylcobyric acid synthase